MKKRNPGDPIMAKDRVRGDFEGSVGASYHKLIRRFPLRPIRSEGELDRAISTVNSLLDRDQLDPDEQDYLDVLGDLIEKYEAEHHPIPPVSDAEMLRFLIESKDVTQAQVSLEAGIAESTISEILAGKHGSIVATSRRWRSIFHVSPAVFLA